MAHKVWVIMELNYDGDHEWRPKFVSSDRDKIEKTVARLESSDRFKSGDVTYIIEKAEFI